jgi:glycosyltransferase involved in cell wall biosynthesis
MEIAYLSQSEIPSTTANSIQVMKMCRSLGQLGHNLTLYCHGSNVSPEKDLQQYDIEQTFSIKKWHIPKIPGQTIILALFSCLNILLRREKPNLLYARSCFSLAACSLFNVPMIYEAHSSPSTIIHHIVEKYIFWRSNFLHLICISSNLKKYYLDQYTNLKEDRILVAHDAADPIAVNTQRAKLTSPREQFNVGYAGSTNPGKGIELIIELAKSLPDYSFHIIGGSANPNLTTSPKKNITNVFYHGRIPHAKVAEYLLAMDILLAPYQKKVLPASHKFNIADWMSPLKLFEYMSAEKPIICSDLPVLREIMKDDQNCLLCKPDNIYEWQQAIIKIHDNPLLSKRISKNALWDFKQSHTWQARAEYILDTIYRK